MQGVRFSVTLLSEAGILVFCDFDRLVSSVIMSSECIVQ